MARPLPSNDADPPAAKPVGAGIERRRTTCTRDCPDACGIVASVEDGRVVAIEGDPLHPVTRGFLCYRTNRFLTRQYAAERVTAPMVRDGAGFREVSWDAALDRIAGAMLRIREESGPEAILHYRSGGSLGIMKHVTDAFFERFGPVAIKSGDICSGAGEAAQEADFGVSDSHDLFDLLHSRTIVLWGKNTHVSNVHLIPVLRRARARGARVVQIDPVRHRGADGCDLALQPRPGGDIALALGVARLLFESERHDPAAATYCDDLDAYRACAFERDADGWASAAGVSVDELRALADLYGDGPSAILVGWGMQRRAHGSAAVRALDALGAISGNLGIRGGGVSFYFRRRAPFDTSFSGGIAVAPRTIPEPLLGPGILEADDPPIRMVWVTAGNPVCMLPESGTVDRALRTRELTVVADSHWTDTARAATIVLPVTTMLEDDDVVGAFGHHWVGEVRPVVAPPGGVRTDYGIVRGLAARVGLGDAFSDDAETWKRRLTSRMASRGKPLDRLRSGAVRSPEAAAVLFEGRRFPTSSGRVRLATSFPVDPPRPSDGYPLLLTAVSDRRAQASQWTPESQVGDATVTVHPDAAAGFDDGAPARLESAIAALDVRVRHDASQRRDVALMSKGGWHSAGRSANALVRARTTDAGGGAVYYDTPVRLVARLTGA